MVVLVLIQKITIRHTSHMNALVFPHKMNGNVQFSCNSFYSCFRWKECKQYVKAELPDMLADKCRTLLHPQCNHIRYILLQQVKVSTSYNHFFHNPVIHFIDILKTYILKTSIDAFRLSSFSNIYIYIYIYIYICEYANIGLSVSEKSVFPTNFAVVVLKGL